MIPRGFSTWKIQYNCDNILLLMTETAGFYVIYIRPTDGPPIQRTDSSDDLPRRGCAHLYRAPPITVHARNRNHRRHGNLQPRHLRDHRGGLPRHTLREALGPHPRRKDQRCGGRIPLPPREEAPVPPDQRPLQGQHVGAEGARLQVHHLGLRRRVPAGAVRPGGPGPSRTSSSTSPRGGTTPTSTTARCTSPSPTPSAPI